MAEKIPESTESGAKPGRQSAGLVIVDKPAGWTSHDVVGRIRRLAGTRKVGHAGTLDPMATGVLVLGINRATRLLGHLVLTEKEYSATIRLGASTVTDDAEGDIVEETPATDLDDAQIHAATRTYVGDIDQVPSAVSAIKVDGKRSYARVRDGEDVQLKSRSVTVSSYEVTDISRNPPFTDVEVTIRCSSGTYIRALARDLGADLGVGGHLTRLRRTRVGSFALRDAQTLEELAAKFSIIDIATAARQTFPVFETSTEQARDIGFGRVLADVDLGNAGPVAMFSPDGEFLALYKSSHGDATAIAVFATVNTP